VKATFFLADAAQVAEGKINALGAFWTVTSIGLPSALVVKIEVPWQATNEHHSLVFQLVDADGNELFQIDTSGFEVPRPVGVPVGTAIDHAMAINLGPLPVLKAGERHVWQMLIDGHTSEEWRSAFFVRPAPTPAPVG
jgi:hypothetical protein